MLEMPPNIPQNRHWKLLFICILFFFKEGISNTLYAQTQKLLLRDSLQQVLKKQTEDTNKVNILLSLSAEYSYNDATTGLNYGNLALNLSKKLNWKKGVGLSYSALGRNYRYQSNDAKALEIYYLSIRCFEELNDTENLCYVLGRAATVYENQQHFDKALDMRIRSLNMANASKDVVQMVSSMIAISRIYHNKGDLQKAYDYAYDAYNKAKKRDNAYSIALASEGLAGYFLRINDDVNYIKYLKIAYDIYSNKNMLIDEENTLFNFGNFYSFRKQYKHSLCYYLQILEMERGSAGNYKATAYLNAAMAYIDIAKSINLDTERIPNDCLLQNEKLPSNKRGLLQKGRKYNDSAIKLYTKVQRLDAMLSCYISLFEIDTLEGNYQAALNTYIKYTAINDSLKDGYSSSSITRVELKNKIHDDSLSAYHEKIISELKYAQLRVRSYASVFIIIVLAIFSLVIFHERKKSDLLLLNILPSDIAKELKKKGSTTAKQFDNVTVLFTDFVNFTQISESMKPQELIDELNFCFKEFDTIITKYGIEKIKTIGDAYMAVSGLPKPSTQHAENIIKAAIEIRDFMAIRHADVKNKSFQIRIGAHSGNVVAGIVGVKKFAYDIWGDTVNTAARMEQNSTPGKINISESTYDLIRNKFTCTSRGEIETKGKGVLKMYFVE